MLGVTELFRYIDTYFPGEISFISQNPQKILKGFESHPSPVENIGKTVENCGKTCGKLGDNLGKDNYSRKLFFFTFKSPFDDFSGHHTDPSNIRIF